MLSISIILATLNHVKHVWYDIQDNRVLFLTIYIVIHVHVDVYLFLRGRRDRDRMVV
jgi:hypothetical protein